MGSHCVSELEQAGWIRRSTIQEAACLTFVRGTGVDQVAEDFGAVARLGRALDIDDFCEEAFAHQEKHPMIALRRVGDWVLVVEDNGRQGQRPEVLRKAARQAAVSVFWDANALTRFSHAVRGDIRTSFEAVLPEYREGSRPDELEAARADLPWSQADPVALMLALAGRLTGLSPSPGWLAGDFQTFPVAPWPDDLVTVPNPLDKIVGFLPELIAALGAAAQPDLLRAVAAVARHTVGAADCSDDPVVQKALSSLSGGPAIDRGELCSVVREWAWQSTWDRPNSKIRNQLRAADALRRATHEDPLNALVGTLTKARQVRGVDAGDLARIVAAELGGPPSR
ncbi:DUF6461 domain-containing protein [Saccharopolyspora sp. NPDC050389]|uniref:DUF6461 domain-containing protein n=1 Tax=Saccharopolyspora sp. NPDC050389 TaxID=3155516 RepID=UPI0033E6010A